MGMAIAAAQQYESNEVVCPLILRKNLFTTAAVDNIDHNPSWATAHDAFHGRGIYSRTPLIRPPSESHWCGRIRGMVAREGFVYKQQNAQSVTRNMVV